MGNVLTLGPPLVVSDDQMHRAMDILDEALGEVELSLRAGPGA
jgi:4-aminobutyrate aminotransferase-like enzyme